MNAKSAPRVKVKLVKARETKTISCARLLSCPARLVGGLCACAANSFDFNTPCVSAAAAGAASAVQDLTVGNLFHCCTCCGHLHLPTGCFGPSQLIEKFVVLVAGRLNHPESGQISGRPAGRPDTMKPWKMPHKTCRSFPQVTNLNWAGSLGAGHRQRRAVRSFAVIDSNQV